MIFFKTAIHYVHRYVKLLFSFCFVLLLFIIDIRQSIEILIFYIDNEEISVFDIMQSIKILLFENFHISPHGGCKIFEFEISDKEMSIFDIIQHIEILIFDNGKNKISILYTMQNIEISIFHIHDIKDITWRHGDTKFLFGC